MDNIQVTHNNDNRHFRIAMDIAKEGSSLWDLTPYVKGRVGDNRFGLQVTWTYQGQLMNVEGMKPYIEGNVGQYSVDDQNNLQLDPNSGVVRYVGDPADCQAGGQVTYYFPEQMFPKEGIFKGYIGLLDDRDDSKNHHISGVTVWFKVLPGIAEMGHACDYYISDLEKAEEIFKAKLRQHEADFQNETNKVISDARNTYTSEVSNAHDALLALVSQIQANRDEQANLSQHLIDTKEQIDQADVVTIPQHKADIDNISAAINRRLSQLHNGPVGIDNADLLKSTYPNGADGTFLTLDTNHIWIWLDNQWRDAGDYQASGLSQEAQQAIENTRSVVLGNELISNGSFATGKVDPAIPWSGDTHLEVQHWSDRNWLVITSDGNLPWKGVQWALNDANKTYFENPVQIDFDINSIDQKDLQLYFVYYDSKGNRLGADLIDTLDLLPNKYTHYENIFYLNKSFANCSYVGFQIVQSSNDKIQRIIITGVSAKEVYSLKAPNENLLNLDDVLENQPDITTLSTSGINNKRWVMISSKGGKQWAGTVWNIPVVQDMPHDPFKLQFDFRGDNIARDFAVAINGWDKNNKQIVNMNLPDVKTNQYEIVHYDQDIIFPSQVANCAKLQLNITSIDDVAINYVMISSLSLKLIPKVVNNGDNLINELLALTTQDITTLSTTAINNKQWLQISSKGGKQWAGAAWNFPVVQDLANYPVCLKFDALNDTTQDFAVAIKGWDKTGKQLVEMFLPSLKASVQLTEYNQTFYLADQVKDCATLQLNITNAQDTSINNLKISDLSLKIVPDKDAVSKLNDTANRELYLAYNLPIMKFDGDLSGISNDEYKKVTWSYYDPSESLTGFGEVKYQGNSSLNWNKKSYRLKTTQSDYTKKDKVKFKASWSRASKFNLKAYYTDGLMSRDVVNAKIGAAIWGTQNNLPTDIIKEDNFGLIEGFPVVLFINNDFAGIYSLNTPRSDFSYTKFAIMGNQWNNLTSFSADNPAVKLDGSDFESLNPEDTPTDDEKTAVNNLINFVNTSSDDDFKNKLNDHISVDSAIDYLIFENIIGNGDAFGKNQILLSWDGIKWFLHPYDLDASYQANWDGKLADPPTDIITKNHKLFSRLLSLFGDQIKKRYAELRNWLTPEYILDKYQKHVNEIGTQNYQREFDLWNDPGKDTEDFKQLREAVYTQIALLDSKWLTDAKIESPANQSKPVVPTVDTKSTDTNDPTAK